MEQTFAADDLLGQLPIAGRFHRVIIEAAANEFIEQFLNTLHVPLLRHQFRIILVPGRKDELLAEHREILTYLEQRDAVRAEQAMRHYIAQLRNSLQQASHLPIS